MKNCTRFFTQEQIDEIRMRLAAIQGAKDSQFDKATYISENDQVAIVQQGKNKRADISLLRAELYDLDDTPTEGSINAVTSDGIYNAIQDVINSIVPGTSQYLYITSDSEMFDYLVNGVTGGRDQSTYNTYCDQLYNAIHDGYFIIIDNAICVPLTSRSSFQLYCISNSKYIHIGAGKPLNSDNWIISTDTVVTTTRFLIDNKYLKDNSYLTNTNLNTYLTNYVSKRDLNDRISQYPEEGSVNLVTSGGIWEAIQNAITSGSSRDEVFIISNDMMDTMLYSEVGSTEFSECCELLSNACENNMLIVFNNGIAIYVFAGNDQGKTFDIHVITTTHLYNISGSYSPQDGWGTYRPNRVSDTHLLTSGDLNTALNSYYTKNQVDSKVSGLQNNINVTTQSISRFRSEYEARMQQTPRYHNANWLVNEVDAEGRVTAETSVVTPKDRFNSMWWAVKESKLITLYGITDIFRDSNVTTSSPDDANSITVKFFIGGIISTYIIEKKYTGNVQSEENLYLQVTATEDQIDRVNQVVGKIVETIDNPTIVGPSVQKYTVDLSNNLDQFNSFSDITGIYDVPLIVDPNLNISPLLGDMKITKCGGLVTDKTDYINIPNILGNPALVVYGSLVDDTMLSAGGIAISIDNDDNLVITYGEINGTVHSLTVDNNTTNDQIASFLNSILKNFNIIRDTNALSFLLSIFQCTVQFNGIAQDTSFFMRTNNSYQLCAINQVSLLEIAEI